MGVKYGRFIAKHRVLIILIAVILLIPAGIGYISTKINYDVLSYLPKSLETVYGQDVMVDEFGMGAFSMVIVEGMENKDVQKLKKEVEKVDHVKEVLWYDDALDITVPVEMLPEELRNATKVYKADVPDDAFYKEKIKAQEKRIQELEEELKESQKTAITAIHDLHQAEQRMHKLETAFIEEAIK